MMIITQDIRLYTALYKCITMNKNPSLLEKKPVNIGSTSLDMKIKYQQFFPSEVKNLNSYRS